jgi:hypothetical protein
MTDSAARREAMRQLPRGIFPTEDLAEFACDDLVLPMADLRLLSEVDHDRHLQEAGLAAEIGPLQFDEYIWFDEMHAVRPRPALQGTGVPDTYTSGL